MPISNGLPPDRQPGLLFEVSVYERGFAFRFTYQSLILGPPCADAYRNPAAPLEQGQFDGLLFLLHMLLPRRETIAPHVADPNIVQRVGQGDVEMDGQSVAQIIA